MTPRLQAAIDQLLFCGTVEVSAIVRGADEFQTLATMAGVPVQRTELSDGEYLEHFGATVDGVRLRVLHPVARVLRVVR